MSDERFEHASRALAGTQERARDEREEQPPAHMTSAEFKAARRELGLSSRELAHILGTTPQTVRKYELDPVARSTARAPNPIACRVMGWLLAGFRPPEWPKARRRLPSGASDHGRTRQAEDVDGH